MTEKKARPLTPGPWGELELFTQPEVDRRELLSEWEPVTLTAWLNDTNNVMERYLGVLGCPRWMVRQDFHPADWEDVEMFDDDPLTPDEAKEVLSAWTKLKQLNRRSIHPLPAVADRILDLHLPGFAFEDEVAPPA